MQLSFQPAETLPGGHLGLLEVEQVLECIQLFTPLVYPPRHGLS